MTTHKNPDELTPPIPVRLTAAAIAQTNRVAAAVDAGAVKMRHDPLVCACSGTDRMSASCIQRTDDVLRYGTVRCASAPANVPSKCAGPTGVGVDPNPCTEPGSLLRCQLCPASPTYHRHTRDRQHSTRCPLTPMPL